MCIELKRLGINKVILPKGNIKEVFFIAAFTLSLDSLILLSGNPIISHFGILLLTSTWTSILYPFRPIKLILFIIVNILRWKKDQNNLGLKVNTAEISKDENEYGTPDIDSTPDNNVDGEDDQDTAPVILSIITGSAPTYIVLTITVMTILATGFYTIKI